MQSINDYDNHDDNDEGDDDDDADDDADAEFSYYFVPISTYSDMMNVKNVYIYNIIASLCFLMYIYIDYI